MDFRISVILRETIKITKFWISALMNVHNPTRPASSLDIYWDMRKRMIAAEFGAGDKLKPDELRDRYGCAASTIREVLFRLSCDRLVSFQDQRGFRVPEVSRETLHELTDLRALVEREGARLSIERGDLEWEADLTAAHHKLTHVETSISKGAQDYNHVLAASEWQFHRTLISACGSETLKDHYRDVHDRQRLSLVLAAGGTAYRDGNIAEHKAILDAALARDAKLCDELLDAHLHRGLETLTLNFA